MTNSFTNRIDNLIERIEREKALRTDDNVDDLSRSLYEFGDYLNGLDNLGVMLEASELGIGQDSVLSMAWSYKRPVWHKR